ncbi:Reticulon-like protein [Actinidia chinensis var. chinensis]|uniref:Reticulon-like protein n=1 Tax=Actinidia chinensis var. chinensis TaxID=1590841 RepID=A0A2R6RX60_ACTCC|nr:Reticulon-like protein [Actinidia chinensis var. chinensis]
MGSSDRLFNRQRTVHQILGGGFVADVMLWRRKNLTVGILVVTLAVWLVFEKSGYTLLSLVSSVLLLLLAILFLWAKSAAILNRPPPPLPDLYLSEELVNDLSGFLRSHINALLSVSKNVALGKDTTMFIKVAAYLWLISFIGGLTDILTLGYTSLVIVLTIPSLYEKYEDYIDRYVLMGCRKLQQLYVEFDVVCLSRVRKWILEKKKLS